MTQRRTPRRTPQADVHRIMLSVRIPAHLVQELKALSLRTHEPVQDIMTELIEDYVIRNVPKNEAMRKRKAKEKVEKLDALATKVQKLKEEMEAVRRG